MTPPYRTKYELCDKSELIEIKEALMQIRLAQTQDIPALLKLLRQILQVHHVGRPDLFRAVGEKYRAEELEDILRDASRPIFVAEEDGAVVGYAFCVYKEAKNHSSLMDRKVLYVDDLCVDEACRGKGVGTVLYEHVLSVAKQEHCYSVELNVWACNESAIRFYEKCGMQVQKIGMEHIL